MRFVVLLVSKFRFLLLSCRCRVGWLDLVYSFINYLMSSRGIMSTFIPDNFAVDVMEVLVVPWGSVYVIC